MGGSKRANTHKRWEDGEIQGPLNYMGISLCKDCPMYFVRKHYEQNVASPAYTCLIFAFTVQLFFIFVKQPLPNAQNIQYVQETQSQFLQCFFFPRDSVVKCLFCFLCLLGRRRSRFGIGGLLATHLCF